MLADDRERAVAEQGVQAMVELLHPAPPDDVLDETPGRVVRAYEEMTRGYDMDPTEILSKRFDVAYDELVALRGIRFTSVCEHHLLPFVGQAAVAYIPSGQVVGLSKLARLVECFACRFQLQERMTSQIADALRDQLRPVGVAVVVRAHHSCMGCRGVRQPDAEMVTSAMHGAFRDVAAARAEVMGLLGG